MSQNEIKIPKAPAAKSATNKTAQPKRPPVAQKPTAKPGRVPKAAKPAERTIQPKARKNPQKQSFYASRNKAQIEKTEVPINIYPLGGLGEIGKNMTVYECNGEMIIVDCGSLFPDIDMYGIDLVIPDFTFIEQNASKIKAVFITHGHEDHTGALPYLLKEINVPIYATRLTIGLIENKLDEHGMRGMVSLNTISAGEKIKIGNFSLTSIHVNHSIPDAVAFAIETPAGIILHTGDFKIDYTPITGGVADLKTFAEYGAKGVLALLSDSTNSEKAGMSASEGKVNESLQNLFATAGKCRIIVATFASNLNRIQQIIDLAVKHGRKVAISGRSMEKNTQMAMTLGYLKVKDGVLIGLDQINKYPPEKVVMVTTGSQGEPLSALSRIAANSHKSVKVGPGDFIIISATPIPGNEKMVTRVINGLLKLGAEVIYESMYDVHASGHACQEEQKLILNLVNPKYFIPLHGEYKHLKRHASTAQSMGISSNNIIVADTGDTITLSRKGIKLGEPVPSGAVMVDGLGVGDVGSVVLRDRRLLSQDGIVVVAATVDLKKGRLVFEPEIFSRGFVYVKDSEVLMEETRLAVVKLLKDSMKDPHREINSLKTKVRETAASLLFRKTKRSPMILPVLMDIN